MNSSGRLTEFYKIGKNSLILAEIRPIKCNVECKDGQVKSTKWMDIDHWLELETLVNEILCKFEDGQKSFGISSEDSEDPILVYGSRINICYIFMKKPKDRCSYLIPRCDSVWNKDENSSMLTDKGGLYKALGRCGYKLVVAVSPTDTSIQKNNVEESLYSAIGVANDQNPSVSTYFKKTSKLSLGNKNLSSVDSSQDFASLARNRNMNGIKGLLQKQPKIIYDSDEEDISKSQSISFHSNSSHSISSSNSSNLEKQLVNEKELSQDQLPSDIFEIQYAGENTNNFSMEERTDTPLIRRVNSRNETLPDIDSLNYVRCNWSPDSYLLRYNDSQAHLQDEDTVEILEVRKYNESVVDTDKLQLNSSLNSSNNSKISEKSVFTEREDQRSPVYGSKHSNYSHATDEEYDPHYPFISDLHNITCENQGTQYTNDLVRSSQYSDLNNVSFKNSYSTLRLGYKPIGSCHNLNDHSDIDLQPIKKRRAKLVRANSKDVISEPRKSGRKRKAECEINSVKIAKKSALKFKEKTVEVGDKVPLKYEENGRKMEMKTQSKRKEKSPKKTINFPAGCKEKTARMVNGRNVTNKANISGAKCKEKSDKTTKNSPLIYAENDRKIATKSSTKLKKKIDKISKNIPSECSEENIRISNCEQKNMKKSKHKKYHEPPNISYESVIKNKNATHHSSIKSDIKCDADTDFKKSKLTRLRGKENISMFSDSESLSQPSQNDKSIRNKSKPVKKGSKKKKELSLDAKQPTSAQYRSKSPNRIDLNSKVIVSNKQDSDSVDFFADSLASESESISSDDQIIYSSDESDESQLSPDELKKKMFINSVIDYYEALTLEECERHLKENFAYFMDLRRRRCFTKRSKLYYEFRRKEIHPEIYIVFLENEKLKVIADKWISNFEAAHDDTIGFFYQVILPSYVHKIFFQIPQVQKHKPFTDDELEDILYDIALEMQIRV